MTDEWRYAECMSCQRKLYKEVMFSLEGTYLCYSCTEIHNGPGTYERYRIMHEIDDPIEYDELATALVLDAWSKMGEEDDYMYNEGWGYCARFGQYLLTKDNNGFVEFDKFSDEAGAEREYDKLYKEGWGASEDDAYITQELNRGWYVSFERKRLDVWTNNRNMPYDEGITQRRCVARVRLESMRTGYYPNLWLVSERGNLSLIPY